MLDSWDLCLAVDFCCLVVGFDFLLRSSILDDFGQDSASCLDFFLSDLCTINIPALISVGSISYALEKY